MYRFFKNKIMIVTMVTIIILIMIAITFGGRNNITVFEDATGRIITPIQKFLTLGSEFISGLTSPVFNVWKMDEENEKLRIENQQLQDKIIDLTLKRQELRDLENLESSLNYVNENGITNYITCNVVAMDPGNWYNMFTIDSGTNKGVTKDSVVMNGEGLIGIVYEAGDEWAKVISIIDNRSRVSFEILSETKDDIGIVNGTGETDLTGYLIDPQSEVQEDDVIITSGLGLYPKGIMIGKIKNVIIKKDELLKTITVESAVNFKKINRVLVIPSD